MGPADPGAVTRTCTGAPVWLNGADVMTSPASASDGWVVNAIV